MAKAKQTKEVDSSTEEKIKEAARIVFIKKGFAATRTRDIAEEAGINHALLSYYFRSKVKLFELIMTDTMTGFLQKMLLVLNNEKTTLDDKVQEVVSGYIDLITREPEIPTFILTEIRNNPAGLLKKLPVEQILSKSFFFKQHREAVLKGKISEPNPLHFLMNLLGLVIFPFLAKPLIMGGVGLRTEEFARLMQERKKLIPTWVKAIMKAK